MQGIDIAIIVILGVFFLLGLVRGLVLQIGSFVSFFLALLIAKTFGSQAAVFLKPSFAQWPVVQETLATVFGFVIVFFASSFILGIIVKLIDILIRRMTVVPFLNMANRLGGAAIGLAEGVFFIGVAALVIAAFPLNPEWDRAMKKSFLLPLARSATKVVTPLIPDFSSYLPKSFDEGLKSLEGIKNMNIQNLDASSFSEEELEAYRKLFEEYQKR